MCDFALPENNELRYGRTQKRFTYTNDQDVQIQETTGDERAERGRQSQQICFNNNNNTYKYIYFILISLSFTSSTICKHQSYHHHVISIANSIANSHRYHHHHHQRRVFSTHFLSPLGSCPGASFQRVQGVGDGTAFQSHYEAADNSFSLLH